MLSRSFPPSSIFFSFKINHFPPVPCSRRLLPSRQVESRAGIPLSIPNTNPRSFDPCSNSLQLERGFSNKSLVSNKLLVILAPTGAEKEAKFVMPSPEFTDPGPWAGHQQAFAVIASHTSELQSPMYLVCRLLLEKKR